MANIYEPKGAAREYSPLALNYIKGCDHNCSYCYVPTILKVFNKEYEHTNTYITDRDKLLKSIEATARKHHNSERQVFLSFTTDPYTHFNNQTKITRDVLKILNKNNIPVSILTKGGSNILQDIDVFKQFGDNIQVGATLIFTDETDQKKWETNSSSPTERFEALKELKQNGIRTWASLEPVIDPKQTLDIIRQTHEYIDYFKVGKMNHNPTFEATIDWSKFLKEAVELLRSLNKPFYIKNDLAKFNKNLVDSITFTKEERDQDYLALKNSRTLF